jgi:hypothetical protein
MSSRDLDQQIGSLLEAWATRDVEGCRFCGASLDSEPELSEQFCDDERPWGECKTEYGKVMTARLAFSKRDLEQRGFD